MKFGDLSLPPVLGGSLLEVGKHGGSPEELYICGMEMKDLHYKTQFCSHLLKRSRSYLMHSGEESNHIYMIIARNNMISSKFCKSILRCRDCDTRFTNHKLLNYSNTF